jgi:hypothetical protein
MEAIHWSLVFAYERRARNLHVPLLGDSLRHADLDNHAQALILSGILKFVKFVAGFYLP